MVSPMTGQRSQHRVRGELAPTYESHQPEQPCGATHRSHRHGRHCPEDEEDPRCGREQTASRDVRRKPETDSNRGSDRPTRHPKTGPDA